MTQSAGDHGVVAFTGGPIETMDGTTAEVLVVAGDRIQAVGSRGLLAGRTDVRIVDLAGKTLLPGLIDAHHHLSIAALHPVWADLAGLSDLDDVQRALSEAARRAPDTPWIRGCNWDAFTAQLRRGDLDAMGFDRPVILACASLHRCVVSSAGLDALGISDQTTDPPGGAIERDRVGVPTGLLSETAWSGAHAASMRGFDDPDRYADHIADRAQLLLSQGITAVHDTAMSPAAESAYRRLAAEGRLPISVLGFPHAAELLTGPDPRRWDGPRTGDGDETFRTGPVKLFADGAFSPACTGHMSGTHVEVGETMPHLAEQMEAAVGHGYAVATHAIGNRAIRAALDAWEAATRSREPDRGLRLEHVTLAGATEIHAMERLGVTGVVQPGFVGSGDLVAGVHWDDLTWMPFATLLEAGVALAASSDFPCTPTSNPLPLSRFGALRRTRSDAELELRESVPMRTWLRLWTAAAADAGDQHRERGRLRSGLRADFVVLTGDIDDPETAVAETWNGGRRVYSAAPPSALG